MQITDNLWLMERFYVDRNEAGELRIVGPENHLYFGAVGLGRDHLVVTATSDSESSHDVALELELSDKFWPDPAMGHIRRVRDHIQVIGQPERSFADVVALDPTDLRPHRLNVEIENDVTVVTYLRTYGEDYYGTRLTWPAGVTLHRDDDHHGYQVVADTWPVKVSLTTVSHTLPPLYKGPILREPVALPNDTSAEAARLYDRTTAEINHLVRNNKTSGFDYGTIFPRDYMETADLIATDLTPQAFAHMYQSALRHVDPSGAGWHEDVVGEFAFERRQEIEHLSRGFDAFVDPGHPLSPEFRRLLSQLDELFVTRMMIDIEPHYLLGLRYLDFEQFTPADQERFRSVAGFIVRRAAEANLITFNRVATPFRRQRADEYYVAGNWRDSARAFLSVDPVIAPYDVNAVFYPQALRVIRDHASQLGIDWREVDGLITKWDRVEDWYRFTDKNGKAGKAVALYGITETVHGTPGFTQLAVHHLDEAYGLFYGMPTDADVASFCERLISPEYFYTPSGPLVVGKHQGYDPSQYHGEVIWTKQTAYVVTGLTRQLSLEHTAGWSTRTRALMQQALNLTARASFQAFEHLAAVPELHIDKHGRAALYTDQEAPEGQMNEVQLWSAAGARPIIRAALAARPDASIGPSPA